MELLEVLHRLAGRGEHDRLAGHLGDGQGGTTAGVAVELREHDTGEVDAVEERLGGLHRVLTDHGVDDEEDLVRVDRAADVRGLLHELFVDAESTGGVDDDDVMQLRLRDLDRVGGDLDRIAHAVARLRGVDVGGGAFADDLELVDRVGSLQVGGDEHRTVALGLQPVGELSGQGRLTGALEAGEHDHRRRALGQVEPPGLAAEDADEFVIDDLDDLLAGVERGRDLLGQCPFADPAGEGAHDRQSDVGIEQGTSDLTDGGIDVGFGQPALAAQILESRGEPVGQGVKHVQAFFTMVRSTL